MKWKITIRFILAVLAVSIVSNLINVFISLYFSYEEYSTTQIFNSIFSVATVSQSANDASKKADAIKNNITVTVKSENNDFYISDFILNDETLSFELYDKKEGGTIFITQDLVQSITTGDGWIQVLGSTGEEIGSINKPEEIKTTYTVTELERAAAGPVKMQNYVYKTIAYPIDPSNPNVGVTYGKYTTQSKNPDDELALVIGIPQPDLKLEDMVDYNLDYFRYLDTQKAVSMVVTLVIALVLGYLLAIRLNRPVVSITDGITAMAGGNYNVNFPKDSYYKDVFNSLNHMSDTLKAGDLERKKTEKIREEWITNISHDLKTPLSSIKGYGELLYESGQDLSNEDLQKYIRVVLEKSAYMDALINDLKLTQKLKNEDFPMNKEKGNLVELLRETVIDILNDPRFEGRHIHYDSVCEDVCMEFDAHLFKRAFTNLVMNAVVHNPAETEIWVRIHRDDRIIVEITDNGEGIARSDQEKLFERYYRGTSTNESYDGSGLGLAIAREIIEAHGGSISLKSEIGEGTTVEITLSSVPWYPAGLQTQ